MSEVKSDSLSIAMGRPMVMERLSEFTSDMQKNENLLIFDLVAGYRHLFLYPRPF